MMLNSTEEDEEGEEMFEMYHQDAIRREHQLEIIKTLGEGTHGKVMLALEASTGRKFAIKTIPKNRINSEREKHHIRREIEIQSRLRHPNIISIHEVYENKTDMTLVMEYASGGELFDYISDYTATHAHNPQNCSELHFGGLSESEAKKLFRQLVSVVEYLHKNGVVHRDLKLENILLDGDGNAKLADFGLSTTFGHGHKLKTYCGSPLYASPEIVNARPYNGPEVDCWSLGVMLYAMLYGLMPFDGEDFRTLRRQITNGLIQQPTVLSSAHGLILHILNPQLADRATLSDILNHGWLRDNPSESITNGVDGITVSEHENRRDSGTSDRVSGIGCMSQSSDDGQESFGFPSSVNGDDVTSSTSVYHDADDKSPDSVDSGSFAFCETAVKAFQSSSSEGGSSPPAFYMPGDQAVPSPTDHLDRKESYWKAADTDASGECGARMSLGCENSTTAVENWADLSWCGGSSLDRLHMPVKGEDAKASESGDDKDCGISDVSSLKRNAAFDMAACGDNNGFPVSGISAASFQRNFSADSLEKPAGSRAESTTADDDPGTDTDGADDSENFPCYEVSDIDAILNRSADDEKDPDFVENCDTRSQVSEDSLEEIHFSK